MRLIVIVSIVAVGVLSYFVWKKNKQLQNADTYAGVKLDPDFRNKPAA